MFKWLKSWWQRPRKGTTTAPTERRPFFDPTLSAGLLADARALAEPSIIELFLDAEWYPGIKPMEVLEEIVQGAIRGVPYAVFVGYVGSRPRALGIIIPPRTLSPVVQVFHFFNAGPTALRSLLAEKMVAWVRSQGYDKAMAFAVRGGPAWEKAFAVGKPHKIGDIYEFDLKE